MKLARHFVTVIRRDLLLAWRVRGDVLVGLMFFVLVATLFPLATSPDPAELRRIGPGVVWVAALLAVLLSLPRLFASDWRDGTLAQLRLCPAPFSITVAGKLVAHWLSTGLPLTLATPLIGIQYALPAEALATLTLSLAIGTPALVALGTLGAALTLGLRQGEVLLALLVLPLAAPLLIFGAGSAAALQAGLSGHAELYLLAAISTLLVAITPWLSAAALVTALEQE
ncbi:heme exporter protein CcmB [Chitinibacteraceae bacterium HSL-7]